MPPRHSLRQQRLIKFETFEPRLVLSGEALVDVSLAGELDHRTELDLPQHQVSTLSSVDQGSDIQQVLEDYGFAGAGQTVAIIDSGIAWDHYALGGGIGPEHTIVGGWDFAENDADPYDDGPAGFHGTHVAGIVASRDAVYRGVAADVDLVSLRVFDDHGQSELAWVEQALQWVHEHRNDFANPITTVNLSLGVEWNANHTPHWATLEDEFARLQADGMFISVAAGNSYTRYGQAGLSYPAVSQHVVPVASHDANGNLSDFSQRHRRAIAAPGESIRSTVPDHLFGGSQSGQFLGASGTSMAAPYVAGSSVVLRQAMEFMGYNQIDQDVLYDHFKQTADRFYDASSSRWYDRLNLESALDAVISDAHGQSYRTATQLGNLSGFESIDGTIGKLTDVDAFRFTPLQTGTVSLTIEASHQLDPLLKLNQRTLSVTGNQASFHVVAGQEYLVSLSTLDGLGHYDLEMRFAQASMTATDIGRIASTTLTNQSVAGETWYQLTTAREGILTAQIHQPRLGIEIYDAFRNQIASASARGNLVRGDAHVMANQTYYVRIVGSQDRFDLQLDNLVSLNDGWLRVFGTAGDDHIQLDTDGSITVTINSTQYQMTSDSINRISVEALNGNDQLRVQLGEMRDSVVFSGNQVFINNQLLKIAAHHFQDIQVAAGGGIDQAAFLATAGTNHFTVSGQSASMTGSNYFHSVTGCATINAQAHGTSDTAVIMGAQGSDRIKITQTKTSVVNNLSRANVSGFHEVMIDGRGGTDSAVIIGSDRNDRITMTGKSSDSEIGSSRISTRQIERTAAFSGAGSDTVRFFDTQGNDLFVARSEKVSMRNDFYQNVATGFDKATGVATVGAGHDRAVFHDSAGPDSYIGNHHMSTVWGSGFSHSAAGFEVVSVIASNGGFDHAVFTGTRGNETMYSEGSSTWIRGSSFQLAWIGWEQVVVHGGGGRDVATLRGVAGNDQFTVGDSRAGMQGNRYRSEAHGFAKVSLDGGDGDNSVILTGFDHDDQLTAQGSALLAYLDGMEINAKQFVWMEAATEENASSSREIGAVDFWYALHGQWR